MKAYEKPMVLTAGEMVEGVYANFTSGGSYDYDLKWGHHDTGSLSTLRFSVNWKGQQYSYMRFVFNWCGNGTIYINDSATGYDTYSMGLFNKIYVHPTYIEFIHDNGVTNSSESCEVSLDCVQFTDYCSNWDEICDPNNNSKSQRPRPGGYYPGQAGPCQVSAIACGDFSAGTPTMTPA